MGVELLQSQEKLPLLYFFFNGLSRRVCEVTDVAADGESISPPPPVSTSTRRAGDPASGAAPTPDKCSDTAVKLPPPPPVIDATLPLRWLRLMLLGVRVWW